MALAVAAASLLAGCAVRRVDDGVFRSPKGYRVTVPGPEWTVLDSSEADLELRHREGGGMVANAECDGRVARRPVAVLERHLLVGLRDRSVLEHEEAQLDGRPATRAVVEAAPARDEPRVRIETYVMTDGRCVYDLLYAAAPERFARWRGDFQRFVGSFAIQAEPRGTR